MELADLSVGLPVGMVVSVRLIKCVEKTAQLPLPEGFYDVYNHCQLLLEVDSVLSRESLIV